MERINIRILGAVLLIALGVLLLLTNLNVIDIEVNFWQWIWAAVFGLAGLGFVAVFLNNTRENWWAVIPGFTLIGLGGLMSVPFLQNDFGGGFFLGMIGLSFIVIYLMRREFWWAVIPGGVMLTLSLVASSSNLFSGMATGGLFFLGLAATFLLVYLLPTPQGKMHWAIWPAAILGAMGVLVTLGENDMIRYVWPIALIVAGGFLVLRANRNPRLQ